MADRLPPPQQIRFDDIAQALRFGRARFLAMPRCSVAYAGVFMVLGLALLLAIGVLGLSPLVLPFAGGFMLMGPVLLAGYFELALRYEQGLKVSPAEAFRAFSRAPTGLWMVALICAFLFLIWITDAGVLYSFTLGGGHFGYELSWLSEFGGDVLRFELWGSLMGSGLAYMIFVISAFSVPLVYERRAGLVEGIAASARTVLGNFTVCLVWGLVLSIVVMGSILLLPLLLVTLPVMAYASFYLYRRVFPLGEGAEDAPY